MFYVYERYIHFRGPREWLAIPNGQPSFNKYITLLLSIAQAQMSLLLSHAMENSNCFLSYARSICSFCRNNIVDDHASSF